MKNIIAAAVVMAIIIVPIFYFCISEDDKLNEDRKKYIGNKVVVGNDTLVIVDYRNYLDDGMMTLSNRVEIRKSQIHKFIIQ